MGEIIEFKTRSNNEEPKDSSEKGTTKNVDTRRAYLFERKKTFKDYVKTVAEELGNLREVLEDNVKNKQASEWRKNIKTLQEDVLEVMIVDAKSLMDELGENDPDRQRLDNIINRIAFAITTLDIDLDKNRIVLISIKQLKEFLEKNG